MNQIIPTRTGYEVLTSKLNIKGDGITIYGLITLYSKPLENLLELIMGLADNHAAELSVCGVCSVCLVCQNYNQLRRAPAAPPAPGRPELLELYVT